MLHFDVVYPGWDLLFWSRVSPHISLPVAYLNVWSGLYFGSCGTRFFFVQVSPFSCDKVLSSPLYLIVNVLTADDLQCSPFHPFSFFVFQVCHFFNLQFFFSLLRSLSLGQVYCQAEVGLCTLFFVPLYVPWRLFSLFLISPIGRSFRRGKFASVLFP